MTIITQFSNAYESVRRPYDRFIAALTKTSDWRPSYLVIRAGQAAQEHCDSEEIDRAYLKPTDQARVWSGGSHIRSVVDISETFNSL